MTRPGAIQRVLSIPPGLDTPWDLLNLPFAECDRAAVDAALARRLARVARHPLARTPDGEEVRMALHAAAAQLRDPAVQRALLEALANRAAPPLAPAPITPASAREQFQRVLQFRDIAARAIVLCGGWNHRSRRMLAAVASANGLSPAQMADALRTLTGPAAGAAPRPWAPPPRPPGPPAPTPRRTFYEELHEPAAAPRAIPPGAIMAAGVALAAVAVVVILSLRVFSALVEPAPGDSADAAPPREVDRAQPPEPVRGAPDSRAGAAATAIIPDPASTTPRTTPQPGAVGAAPPLALDPAGADPPRVPDPAGLVRLLRQSADLSATNPGDAAWRLEGAVGTLSGAWASLEPSALDAAHDAIASFLVRSAPGGESAQRAMAAVSAGALRLASADRLEPHDVWPAAWSVGMLARLDAEPALPRGLRDYAREALSAAIGDAAQVERPTFWDGARAALAHMAAPLSAESALGAAAAAADGASSWDRWTAAVRVITVGRREDAAYDRDALHLLAVEALMLHGPPLAQSAPARRAAEALLAGATWIARPTALAPPPAYARLISWLEDSRFDSPDLAVVTEWVVRSSGAPGVGLTMALGRAATIETRASLRDRYALLWGEAADARENELALHWRRAADHALRAESNPNSLVSSLARAAELARYSEAAARRWRRESSAAAIITRDARGPVERALAATAAGLELRTANAGEDGRWALEFLAARASAERMFAAVSRLEMRSGDIGPIDGDVLARAALLGAPVEVRSAAQRAVRRHASQPAVVNGLLESLPAAPRNDATRRLLEDVASRPLPRSDDPAYPVAARRALVDALLELLAARADLAAIDRLAVVLTDAYAGAIGDSAARAGAPAPPPMPTEESEAADAPLRAPGAAQPHAADRARALTRAWRDEADRFVAPPRVPAPLPVLDRRRAGRAALARGPVQEFAAEQASLAEVMAFVVSAERPSRSPEIGAILSRLAERRRAAPSVLAQIEAGEEALLALWMVRFGEEPPREALTIPAPAQRPAGAKESGR